jgi:PTS system galactitol-specific IIA component
MSDLSAMSDVACREDLILLGIEAASHEDAIRALSARLEAGGYVRPSFAEAVIDREKTFPTGLPTQPPVAIPHTDVEHCLKPAVAVATLKRPVSFQAMGRGGELQVGIIFLLSITNPQSQVGWLGRLVQFFQEPGLLSRLTGAASAGEVAEILNDRLLASGGNGDGGLEP